MNFFSMDIFSYIPLLQTGILFDLDQFMIRRKEPVIVLCFACFLLQLVYYIMSVLSLLILLSNLKWWGVNIVPACDEEKTWGLHLIANVAVSSTFAPHYNLSYTSFLVWFWHGCGWTKLCTGASFLAYWIIISSSFTFCFRTHKCEYSDQRRDGENHCQSTRWYSRVSGRLVSFSFLSLLYLVSTSLVLRVMKKIETLTHSMPILCGTNLTGSNVAESATCSTRNPTKDRNPAMHADHILKSLNK